MKVLDRDTEIYGSRQIGADNIVVKYRRPTRDVRVCHLCIR